MDYLWTYAMIQHLIKHYLNVIDLTKKYLNYIKIFKNLKITSANTESYFFIN